jgi:hypothetical protein
LHGEQYRTARQQDFAGEDSSRPKR